MPDKPRIVVIGAGLAGLTAAWHLRPAGLAPTVFEAQRQPGGRMRSTVTGGMIHDLGAWTRLRPWPASLPPGWGGARQQMVEFWVQRWPCAVAYCDPQAHQRATALDVRLCALADRVPCGSPVIRSNDRMDQNGDDDGFPG